MALAKWYKIDFHTHTPESRCFPDKKVTPKEWLKAAKDSGLNAVVVSDHNSVGWVRKIEEIKTEFEDEKFKIFYGIELCVSSDFTHFLIIFDDNKMSVTEIEDAVVQYLGLARKDWADTTVNVSEDKLKTLCMELKEKIFVIPDHFASNKGLGKSTENAIRKYKEFLSFSAIEVRNDEDVREYSNKMKNKAINKYKNDTLSSIVKVLPEDKLQIKIIDENGEIDINEGSPGQKSAAILAFILNSGENPLIIDQPEDDLDNSLIYSLVVKSIRKMKSKRQIIIVTHNPNIPVLGDAEGIIVLERSNQGKVTFRKNKKAGCIEEKLIREGICEIMEGGEDAFRKREQKYQYK